MPALAQTALAHAVFTVALASQPEPVAPVTLESVNAALARGDDQAARDQLVPLGAGVLSWGRLYERQGRVDDAGVAYKMAATLEGEVGDEALVRATLLERHTEGKLHTAKALRQLKRTVSDDAMDLLWVARGVVAAERGFVDRGARFTRKALVEDADGVMVLEGAAQRLEVDLAATPPVEKKRWFTR